eukprot:CAMPEP_0196653162 /NCGR_PEP_ID=MMETSP1086-20130531/2766_1 /TAXON_ID=77921 /ORGANISM="Cyanoptyche  gloeocystis , Strain SAG4.97" /LENGTH=304 /DNA_ID=CAMNT_0041984219 /DNA_START=87 /DNA_END=1001 /DNA_ORIENTATION=-
MVNESEPGPRTATTRWADTEEADLDFDDNRKLLPQKEEFEDNGVKTIIEYSYNADNQLVKTTTKIRRFKKTVKLNKRVEARKKWKKFGNAADAGKGAESGITSIGDEVFLETKDTKKKESRATGDDPMAVLAEKGKTSIVICRTCGQQGDHWTLRCPYKDKLGPAASAVGAVRPTTTEAETRTTPKPRDEDGKGSKYVPPAARAGATKPGDRMRDSNTRDEVATIRVTNLSEDTKEPDLQELFYRFGQIQRIFLAKDKQTGLSKGFAFINFVRREDAARAIEKLSGYGYDHLILHVEWAKPSNN